MALPVLVAGVGPTVCMVHSFDPASGVLQWSYEVKPTSGFHCIEVLSVA
jgi:hypothetical protein